MYSEQEIEAALDDRTALLSGTIYKTGRYAQTHGFVDLIAWCESELSGYTDSSLDAIRVSAPYRVIYVTWHNIHDQELQLPPNLGDLQALGLHLPIIKLEGFAETGAQWRSGPQREALSRHFNTEVAYARVSAYSVKTVLQAIHSEARKRFHDAVARKPLRSLAYPEPAFATLVTDQTLASILSRRWAEANACYDAHAYLATLILLGSMLEGVLLARVKANPAHANNSSRSPKDTTGKPAPWRQWTLNDLIEVGHECGWLNKEARDFSKIVRDYRNFVHPNQELVEGVTVGENLCRITWEVVIAALQ